MKHAENETLIDYFEGLMSADEAQKIVAHLAECGECAMQAQKIENFFAYLKSSDYEEVPQATTANLLNIFVPPKRLEKASFIKKLLAVPVFDDWQIALNERFIFADRRQMLYRAEDFEIDLRLEFSGEKCQVSGQVFPDCENALIEIFSTNSHEKVSLNNDCEFVFPAIENGIYNLRISLPQTIIDIENISLLN